MDIEKAKKICKAYINAIDTFGTIDYKCINNLYEPIEVVLSELEQKDKEIEQLKSMELKAKYGIASITLEGLINLENGIKKRDKIIDEMAKFIAGLDIDELICKDIEYCIADDEYTNCESCLIKYFTKKVEGKYGN